MKRQPASLWLPKLTFRQITARRNVRSAWLLVGSTPSTRAKACPEPRRVHKAG